MIGSIYRERSNNFVLTLKGQTAILVVASNDINQRWLP